MRVAAMGLLLSSLALSSCGHKVDTSSCPPIKEYTEAENKQAFAELLQLCPGAKTSGDIARLCPTLILPTYMDDYKLERDALRPCQIGS